MELLPYHHHAFPWRFFLARSFLSPPNTTIPPSNYVHWNETPESHIYTANITGVRKEDIRVEVEDSRYMVIRTEESEDGGESPERDRRSFMRKFRLPQMVNVDGISAGYEDGVLTVTVPRSISRGRLIVDPQDLAAQAHHSVARAA
ncbi:15.4 kDa class V heat shock protein [Phoenix dactylifera]|uniref:15.4 kDa class V heat shock protein n=1 Tax=Phoenix dactylifera TaxID=42345 RepID=A0A8B7BKZ9_PHODC|nr:15.4 kDa class V heat shock protein [Phoenix dactylifera]